MFRILPPRVILSRTGKPVCPPRHGGPETHASKCNNNRCMTEYYLVVCVADPILFKATQTKLSFLVASIGTYP